MTANAEQYGASMLILAHARNIFAPKQVVEVRVPKAGRHGTISGFFDNGKALADACAELSGKFPGVYVTLNPLRPDLLERSPNRLTYNADKGTLANDNDVAVRRWLLIDADPVRQADVSSTDTEKALAMDAACSVRAWLSERGWPEPILADSGNGAHLLYRIDLPNDDDAKALVHGVLRRLAAEFDAEGVKIDTKVANASRICKAYGTVSAKGEATDDRPHRVATLIDIPAPLTVVSVDLLKAVQPVEREKPRNEAMPAMPPAPGANRYALAALESAASRVAGAGQGARNDTLNTEAFGVFQLVAGGALGRATAWAVIQDAAERCGLDQAEINSTMQSAWDGAQKSPRTPPEPQQRQPQSVKRLPANVDPETGEILDGMPPAPVPAPANDNALMQPLDIFAECPAPGLQRGMLPKAIEDYSFECGEHLGVSPGMVAIPAIVACAAALHDGVQIRVKRHEDWRESARLWCAIVGEPSVKKSPSMARATKRLRKIDIDLSDENARRQADYADQAEQYKDAKKEAKKMGGGFVRAPEPPKIERMVVEDATIEALSEVLKDNARGVLCVQDELSGWFGMMDAYTGNKGGSKDRAAWLQAYNGGGRVVDRVMRGSFKIPNWSVSMIGGIQPDAIRRIAQNMTEDGLMQRFMIVIGENAPEFDRPENKGVYRSFSGLVDQLYGVSAGSEPVTMTEGAHGVREALNAYAGELSQYPALPGGLRAHLGKWSGLFARLLLIFHAIDCACDHVHPASRQATEETALRVDRLMRKFLLPHAMAYYTDVLGGSGDLEHARWVAGHILSKGLHYVSNRDLTQAYKQWRGLDDWRRQRIMQTLEDMGWVTPYTEDGQKPSRRGATHWAVSLRVHEIFATKARSEASRRERLRSEIVAMQGR